MSNNHPYLSTYRWLLFDEALNPAKGNPNSALAYQDSLIRWIPQQNDSIENATSTTKPKPYSALHLYPYNYKTVLLGAKDTRLKELSKGNQYLIDNNYTVVQRPHGGLAVVNDPGIINVGLVSDSRYFPLSIDEAYEEMVDYIRLTLAKYDVLVESYEIPDSYCPGKFDLVVNGRKIGGIAQRRFKTGVTTAAYLSVNGNQHQRAELLRNYYQLAEADETYPNINPDSMTTIEEVIQQPINLTQFRQDLLDTLQKYASLEDGDYSSDHLQAEYSKALNKLATRSRKL